MPSPRAASGIVSVAVCALAGLLASGRPCGAYTPRDPLVSEMVRKGSTYLESLSAQDSGSTWSPAGGQMLVAYAHYKANVEPGNRVVQRGVAAAENYVRGLNAPDAIQPEDKSIYEISVAALLLAEVDPIRFKPELNTLQQILYREQFPHGGWGYRGDTDGDTSQTQYALLALWTLDHVGVPLDYARVKKSAEWLMRVQDIEGGWPYHGEDPGQRGGLIRQQRVSMSTTLAGASSLLIAGDALRAWGDTKSGNDPDIEGLPEAVRLYRENLPEARRRVSIPEEPVFEAIRRCEQYQQNRPYNRPPSADWYYYQLYTQERYESFIEIAKGLEKDESPAWYNRGVDELRESQDPDSGGFGVVDRTRTSPAVSTAFAILFLIRSTQKAIVQVGRGTLAGGRDLPSDTTDVRVEGTQIKGRPVAEAVSGLLDILEEDGEAALDEKTLPENLQLANDPDQRAAQLDRLQRLVRGSRSWQARRVAARVLGTSDEVSVVPALIYALSDPDSVVRRYARDGLRFISRKFDGFGLPDKPTDQEVRDAQRAWAEWYRTIDPTYVFLEYDL